MPVEYMEFEEARAAKGLRMVVVSGVPSPWGEAAKGILNVKNIPWKAVRLDPTNDALADWTKDRSGPVAMYEDEAPRSSWSEILLLAERLEPKKPLLPSDASERAEQIGIAHEICGVDGLGWTRRLQGIHQGLNGEGGFPPPVAKYLGEKYGYRADEASRYQQRVIDLLDMLAGRLHRQHDKETPYYFGNSVSAIDIYSATFMALFKPLPPEQCPMAEHIRPAFELSDEVIEKVFDPILIEHRNFVYGRYLELPLSL
jgi:glutathione S-transferase